VDTPSSHSVTLITGSSQAFSREPAIDAARVVTMVLVVVLHACVAYMAFPIPGLLWPVQEKPVEGSTAAWFCDAVFHLSRVLSVPLATLIAGFVGARALQRHSRREFVRERWHRLGVPLLYCIVLVLVPLYLIWAWGWIKRGWAAPEHILHGRFGPAVQPHLYGLAHLWYLQYMLVYAGLLAWAWPWIQRARAAGKLRLVLRHGQEKLGHTIGHAVGQVVLCMCVIAPALVLWPTSVQGFHNGFLPEPGQFVKHLCLFVMGVLMGMSTLPLRQQTRCWSVSAIVALSAAWFVLDQLHARHEKTVGAQWQLMAGVTILIGSGISAMLGGLVRVMDFVPASLYQRVRQLAQASMWVYLVHLIPQGVAVVLLYRVDMPVVVKMLIVSAVGLGVPLLVWWIRHPNPNESG